MPAAGRKIPSTIALGPEVSKRLELAARKMEREEPGRVVRIADLVRALVVEGCNDIIAGRRKTMRLRVREAG